MRKKLFLLFGSISLVLILVMLPMMAGCKAEEVEVEGEEVAEGEEAEAETYKIIYDGVYGPKSPNITGMKLLEEMWEEAAPGRLEWEYHYNQALYSVTDHPLQLAEGGITLWIFADFGWIPMEPLYGVFALPFIIESDYHKMAIGESPWMIKLDNKMEDQGIHPLYHMDMNVPLGHEREIPGMYAFYSKFPIHTMEDLADKRMRVMKTEGHIKLGDALGFSAQAIDFQEVAVSLQTGMLDGLVTCPYLGYLVPLGVFDNLDYCLWWPPVQIGASMLAVNADWWYGLPDDLRSNLESVIPAYQERKMMTTSYPEQLEAAAAVREKLEVTELTVEEYERWLDATKYIWYEWAEGVEGGKEAVDAIIACRPS